MTRWTARPLSISTTPREGMWLFCLVMDILRLLSNLIILGSGSYTAILPGTLVPVRQWQNYSLKTHAYDWQYIGFALQILERQQEIMGSIGSLDETNNTCTEWDNWLSANPTVYNPSVDQDDSGIWGSDRSLFLSTEIGFAYHLVAYTYLIYIKGS